MSSHLDKTLFNMKLQAKMLAKEALKKEREQKELDKKVLSLVGKNEEKMKLYAAEAIRCQSLSLQYTRLSLRVEAVASRVYV